MSIIKLILQTENMLNRCFFSYIVGADVFVSSVGMIVFGLVDILLMMLSLPW